MTKEHKFTLPIGDWSDDGHGKCEYYNVKSNKSVEEVREIHFESKEKFGFTVTDFANEYENSIVPCEIVNKLIDLGFEDYEPYKNDSWADNMVRDEEYYANSSFMAHVWAFLLMKADDTLELEFEKEYPMLSFYGFDNKKRHIDFVGYGCFY